MSNPAVFRQLPRLVIGRLRLRQGLDSDAPAFFAIKSNAAITASYAQEPHSQIEDSRLWLERARDSHNRGMDYLWVMELAAENRVIGSVTLWNFQETAACAELGYEIHPDYEGRGYMSEAVQAVLIFGFEILELQRIETLPLSRNQPSRRLLERNGFTLEGIMRQKICFHEDFLDQCIYALLRSEWQEQKEKNRRSK